MKDSKIQWCDHTFNGWIGCSKVSAGCANCYAETLMDTRYGRAVWGPDGTRSLTCETTWSQPLKWNKEAQGSFQQVETLDGRIYRGTIKQMAALELPMDSIQWAGPARPRVFCASASDVFEEWDGAMCDHRGHEIDGNMETWRRRLFALIMVTKNLDWLILTKRPENARRWFSEVTPDDIWVAAQDWEREFQPANAKKTLAGHVARTFRLGEKIEFAHLSQPHTWPLSNVLIGTTVEGPDQQSRIEDLLHIPAVKRFLSCEPLLGSIDLTKIGWADDPVVPGSPRTCLIATVAMLDSVGRPAIDWVICGGESGPNARPMHPDWARSLRDQCAAGGVPFLFKQWGEWCPESHADFESSPAAALSSRNAMYEVWPGGMRSYRIGKERAGRLLDGVEHNEFPVIGGAR